MPGLPGYTGVPMKDAAMPSRFLALAALFLASCAHVPQVNINSADLQSASGKTFTVAVHKAPDAKVQTGGKTALFGWMADPYFISEGARIQKEDNLSDPANVAADIIAAELSKNHGMTMVAKGPEYNVEEGKDSFVKVEPEYLTGFYKEGDYILDADTAMWWMMYNLGSGYDVFTQSYVRLIRRSDNQVVAAKACGFGVYHDLGERPSYDELLDNKGAKLNHYLVLAGEKCAKDFIAVLNGKPSDDAVAAK